MKPLISVIIPIYNIQNYVKDCVQSVIAQSYNNLEILLVDDGSTDGSGRICDEYKLKDERIDVIHKTNGGLSDARNVAIDICKGTYITFIDGDDVVSPHYVKTLYDLLASTNSQIAICGHKDFYDLLVDDACSTDSCFEYSPNDAIKEILINGRFTTSAWGKLYKKELFEEIRYPKGKLFEDLPTTWRTFDVAEKIVFTPSQLYYYRQNPTSIMNCKFNPKKLDIIYSHQILIRGLEELRPDLAIYGYERAGTYASIQLYSALISGYQCIADLRKLRTEIRRYMKYMLTGSYPLRIKIFGFCAAVPLVLELIAVLNKIRVHKRD